MTDHVSPIPEGHRGITPAIVVKGGDRAIDFYCRAFGAEEVLRLTGPDDQSILHAELKLGGGPIYVYDEWPGMGCPAPETLGGTTVSLHLYVEDVDAAVARAVAEGAEVTMPPADMFWGDRYAKLADPFGHAWAFSSRKEIVPIDEMRRRAEAMFAEMATQPEGAAAAG